MLCPTRDTTKRVSCELNYVIEFWICSLLSTNLKIDDVKEYQSARSQILLKFKFKTCHRYSDEPIKTVLSNFETVRTPPLGLSRTCFRCVMATFFGQRSSRIGAGFFYPFCCMGDWFFSSTLVTTIPSLSTNDTLNNSHEDLLSACICSISSSIGFSLCCSQGQ